MLQTPETQSLLERQARLRAAAQAMSVRIDDAQIRLLVRYVEMIAKWNKVYNLTAIRDVDEMLVQHIFDSMALVNPLQVSAPDATLLIDVGSGAGLPGVVLGVCRPSMSITCVDAVSKKASFIQQVAAELPVKNVSALHHRIESLAMPLADVVTARAFSSLASLVESTSHLLKMDGVWMAMKGKVPQEEIASLPTNVQVFHVEQLNVYGLAADRCIVWLRRKIN
jgi:16S rRNA (guanine527-N7)-methyltransferase